jgi:hypothetical protein
MNALRELEGKQPVAKRSDFPESMEPWVAPCEDIPMVQPQKGRKSVSRIDQSAKKQIDLCLMKLENASGTQKPFSAKKIPAKSAAQIKPTEKRRMPVQAIIGTCIVLVIICSGFIGRSSATSGNTIDPVPEPLLTMEAATDLLISDPTEKEVTVVADRFDNAAHKNDSYAAEYAAAIATAMGTDTDETASASHQEGFLITLSNGAQMITNTYWEDGNTVYFREGENMIGLPKAMVRSVDKSRFYHNALSPVAANDKAETGLEKAMPDLSNDENQENYMKGYFTLKKRFNNLSGMTNDEIYRFSEDLLLFRNEILQSQRGILYDNQIQAVYAMLDDVEQTIVQR